MCLCRVKWSTLSTHFILNTENETNLLAGERSIALSHFHLSMDPSRSFLNLQGNPLRENFHQLDRQGCRTPPIGLPPAGRPCSDLTTLASAQGAIRGGLFHVETGIHETNVSFCAFSLLDPPCPGPTSWGTCLSTRAGNKVLYFYLTLEGSRAMLPCLRTKTVGHGVIRHSAGELAWLPG